jgi:hypothetical protein
MVVSGKISGLSLGEAEQFSGPAANHLATAQDVWTGIGK